MLIDEPGCYDIPEDLYHLDPLRHLGGSASSTALRHLLAPSCPALARHEQLNPVHKDAYDLGSVTHRLILGSGCDIVEVPAASWSTNAAKDARAAARAEGKVALLTKDLFRAMAMRDAVHANDLARTLLTLPGRPEQTLAWLEDVDGSPVWCRARFDRWPEPVGQPIAVDLKTTQGNLSDADLAKSIAGFGYHQQADFYSRGYYSVHGVWPAFVFVFVRAEPPHLVRVVELDGEAQEAGREQNDAALRVWRECCQSGEWPGPGAPGLASIGLPRWYR